MMIVVVEEKFLVDTLKYMTSKLKCTCSFVRSLEKRNRNDWDEQKKTCSIVIA